MGLPATIRTNKRRMPDPTPPTRFPHAPLLTALGVCLYAVVVLRTAWLSDDAYITFRTVDNFVNGYGLTWNVVERAQAYTHPLWMLLLSGLYGLSREIYFTSIFLCVGLSVATVLVFALRVAVGALPALVGTAVFVLSKAFVDYSTSGLEHPLTHFLLMLCLFVYVTRPPDRRTLLWLSLLAAMLALNRMDALLLVVPALCVVFYRVRSLSSLGTVVLGFAPFLAWEAFALFYYGSLLPNTAFAKLNTGIPAVELIRQGLLYLYASLTSDPLTPVATVTGLAIPFITRRYRQVPLALGALAYLLYVVGIGGDFMRGRFLTAPLLIAVVLLARAAISNRTALVMFIPVVLIAVVPTYLSFRGKRASASLIDENGICNERAFYYHGTGLLRAIRGEELPNLSPVRQGQRARERGEAVVVARRIGMFGFFAGPHVHIVDEAALADPLLARLKPQIQDGWRIGHLWRRIPDGYIETLRTGENVLADPQLAEYYAKLRLITRGPLWDRRRCLEIIKFNLGAYDELLTAAQR